MLEENEEDSEKEGDDSINDAGENCEDKTVECDDESNEVPQYTQEKTLDNHVDCGTSVELTNEVMNQTANESSETASNDAMSLIEEQVEPGK